jgi:hypothetical protein
MNAVHGGASRRLTIQQGGEGLTGSFGRMFPTLEARRPTGLEMAKKFGLPGGMMDGGQTTAEQENPRMHAGFTFFGQFIDHDLTLDATSVLDRQSDPNGLTDFRSPRLDMDNLYGAGPTVSPQIYDQDSHQTKLLTSADGVDLGRTSHDVALIADPRNDENLLLAQLHLAFIKFHNRVVDQLRAGAISDAFGQFLPPKPPDEPRNEQPNATLEELLDVDNYWGDVFAGAQRLVRWHFQWIVVHQFLPLVCDPGIVSDVLTNGPRYFRPEGRPFIPAEFTVAAFRLGHPTIRSSYQVNEHFTGKVFPDNPDMEPTPRTDLRGGPVDAEHAVDFSFLFPTGSHRRPQHAKRFEAKLNTQLLDLPVSAVPGARDGALARPVASLAVRNLLRSESVGLPSGQDVARKVGEVPLTDAELETHGPIYLWYYILKEAELRGAGEHLGPVGSRIVTEVLIGLLDADPTSYRSAYPQWRPTLGSPSGHFSIVDLLRFAGVTSA